jgi:hypothetical protein
MSIVPKEVVVDAPAAWNAQADEFNQWDDLGEYEKLEWTANRAAEWALSQAIEACESIVTECAEIEDREGAGAAIGCKLRILNILAGGESDGQN